MHVEWLAQAPDEENMMKSLSLPLLPKLPLCNRDSGSLHEAASGGV